MEKENFKFMKKFDLKNLPSLDKCVLGALELFIDKKLDEIKILYKKPLVIGSGNAEVTGKIIFEDKEVIFANENNFLKKIKNKTIDGVVIISSSGKKHAPLIARYVKKLRKDITLITNSRKSPVNVYLKKLEKPYLFVFPKQREPYSYNVSTYLGMILSKTKENPKHIYNFILKKINKIKFPKFNKYRGYFLIIPPEFSEIKRMLEIKFMELFGRRISKDVETNEYIKHSTTIVPSNELFISFGEKNNIWGKKKDRLFIPLPKNSDYGAMMAISYFVIGKIQNSYPAWFKNNLERYTKNISKIFKQKIKPIIE